MWPGQSHGLAPHGAGSLATIGERFGARFIDGLIWLVLVFPVMAVENGVRAVTGVQRPDEGDAFSTLVGFLLFAVFIGYDPVTTRLFGATPGKRAVGLEVVREDTLEPAGAFSLAGRSGIQVLLWTFCFLPGVADVMSARQDQLKRTWHDRALRTVVVRTRSSRAGAAPVQTGTISPPTAPVPRPVAPLPEPWASLVREASEARQRFATATSGAIPGPLRERLDHLRRDIDACVYECQRLAARGADIAQAANHLDVERVRTRAHEARVEATQRPNDRDALELADALESEAESAVRLRDLVATTHRRVQRLVARLNDAVNRGMHLVYDGGDTTRFDALVEEISALQAGIAEVEQDLGGLD